MWPISSTVVRSSIAFRKLMYSAPIYSSAAEVIPFLIICAMVNTAPSFAGFAAFFDMKKFPPSLLFDFG